MMKKAHEAEEEVCISLGTRRVGACEVTLERDEDDWIVVGCPALKGCWSQGRTEEEALANIAEAIEGWLEVAAERAAYPGAP